MSQQQSQLESSQKRFGNIMVTQVIFAQYYGHMKPKMDDDLTKMEDDFTQNGRRPKWKTTTNEEDQNEDDQK